MFLMKRDSCAPHTDGSSDLYDSNGNLCGGISQQDKIMLGASMGACGIVLAVLALIYIIRWRMSRVRREMLAQEESTPQFAITAPLVTRPQPLLRDSRSESSNSSHSSHSPRSPYSPYLDSDHSHMPILSADGHLLPVPQQAAWENATGGAGRALPSPPTPEGQEELIGLYAESDMQYDKSHLYEYRG